MPLRVLYLTMNPNRASTTVPTEGWLRLLRARGLDPVLVSRSDGGFQTWVRAHDIPTYQDDLPFPGKRDGVPFLRSLWALCRIVRRHRIQLIHCNEHDVYPIGQYAGRCCGIPVVLSVHFTMDRGFCEWAFGGRRQPARIFFVSRGNLEACRAAVTGVVDERRWRVMYNGLDLEHFRPDLDLRQRFRAEHGLASAFVIGVACAFRPRKQLEHLIQAVSRLAAPDLRVIIAGGPVPGDERYAAGLLQHAQETLGDRLLLLGYVDELRGLYNGLDVFVNTSEEEACSISVMQSLACGTPVLGYPSKSVDDQILPDGGEIVAQNDIGALADRLHVWTADRDHLTARRRFARARAEEMFDIRKQASQLWKHYEGLVPSGPKR
jgi:glycosyltransferase involved in cell wall biosynthesis